MENRFKIKGALKSVLESIGTGGRLDQLIKRAGYAYDAGQNIFYSTMNPWQRKMGYCSLYDEAGPTVGMIVDCEPIRFEYAGKRWLIEFWKGQYSLSSGCEVGIYNTDKPDISIPGIFSGPIYQSASDQERLPISYTLYNNGETFFTRQGLHWWLTGFRLGHFSEPQDLTMDIEITLKDKAMHKAFIRGLTDTGYSDRALRCTDDTVCIYFDKPHSPQPSTRSPMGDWIVQRKNQLLCSLFTKLTRTENADVLTQEQETNIYDAIINLGKNKQLYDNYEIIKKYLI